MGAMLYSLQSADLLDTREGPNCRCTIPASPCKKLCTCIWSALQTGKKSEMK